MPRPAKNSDTLNLTSQGQMAIFWRILHMMVARHGSHPTGHLLVALTMIFLNERGRPPTLTEICEATGLPKASVSRFVNWQINQGLVREMVDPRDRRKRYLTQTAKGKKEWQWEVQQLDKLFAEIVEVDRTFQLTGNKQGAEELLGRMRKLTRLARRRQQDT
jgi:DNA-binding MarR family transcriptional regulator